jgi:hypothetical protein
MRKLDQRVAPSCGRAPHARRGPSLPSCLAVPAGAEQQPSFFAAGRATVGSQDKHIVVLVGDLGDQLARADRADLLVGLNSTVSFAKSFQPRPSDLSARAGHGNAALVVGDPWTIDALAVDLVRLGGENAAFVDGVHMRHQHHLLVPEPSIVPITMSAPAPRTALRRSTLAPSAFSAPP